MEKNKTKIIMIGLIVLLLSIVGGTYAYWILVKSQSNENNVLSSCFHVTFSEDSTGIQLQKAYPITDEDGKKLTPYTFTIKNNCSTAVYYEINLEVMSSSTLERTDLIKVQLDDHDPMYLMEENDPVLKESKKAFKIGDGYFQGQGEKTFDLRMWIDEKTTTEDPIQNTKFLSKISMKASYVKGIPLIDTILDLSIVKDVNSGISGLYEVTHSEEETQEMDEGWRQSEYRFAGKSDEVNNHIIFDGDLWRIIGLVNVLIPKEDGSTQIEQRVKIIRKNSIGSVTWDTSETNINNGFGVNEWSDADLMKVLNPGYEEEDLNSSLFWRGENGHCYNGRDCYFSNAKMPDSLKKFVEEVVWNTGTNGINGYVTDTNGMPSSFYSYERSNVAGDICKNDPQGQNDPNCNDQVTRSTTWKGKVGLMYPSDYGYATSGNNELGMNNRTSCLKKGVGIHGKQTV